MNDCDLQNLLAEMADLPCFCHLPSVSVTTRGAFGNTPLHVAAVRGDVRAIVILLRAGADINAPGEHGYTPLHEAVEQGHAPAVRVLLDHGADTTARTDGGFTALDLARMEGNREILNFLGHPGVNPD
jgi:ankyrin repeat protein